MTKNTETVDLESATTRGETTTREYRHLQATYQALEIQVEGKTYNVPIGNIDAEDGWPTWDAEWVLVHDGSIYVGRREDDVAVDVEITGELGTDGNLSWGRTHETSIPEDADLHEFADRILWERGV